MEPLHYLIKANLTLGVLVLAYAVLIRRTTRFDLNRATLWSIALLALGLPLADLSNVRPAKPIQVAVSQTKELFQKPLERITAPTPPVYLTFPQGKTYPASFNEPRLPQWPTTLLWLYGSVVTALLIRFGYRLIRLRLLIEKGIWTPYTDFVLVQAPVDAPFSFGGFVVLDLSRYTPFELDQILRHERVHVVQQHTLDLLLAESLTMLCWLNPAAYLFRRLVNQNLEYVADRAVLAEGIDARAYQFSLLRVSLGAGGPSLTNRFGESGIADRIRMMIRPRSGAWVWLRYWVLAGIVGAVTLVLATRETGPDIKTTDLAAGADMFACPEIIPLKILESGYQYRVNYTKTANVSWGNVSVVGLENNHLTVLEDYRYNTEVFINCQPAPVEDLQQIESEYLKSLFVLEQASDVPNPSDKPWLVVVETSPTIQQPHILRNHFLSYLQAAAQTKHPLGYYSTFSMNDVLEATFFHRKEVLVERTKNDYLKLYDEFLSNTDVLINGIPTDAKQIETVHVREVDKIHTTERNFSLWFRPQNPAKRFVINIETSPKRAKRDTSYYVFSPFYSGDF